MDTPKTTSDNTPLRVRRGRVESVDLYEVKDNELDLLEKGSPASIQLNFAIFLLSIAFTCIVALCTATFESNIVSVTFIIIAVIGNLFGLYLLIVWWSTKKSISAVVKGIRSRMESLEPLIQKKPPDLKDKPVSETKPSA